jgi:5-formaminoimidazole-4-carboxamide-1-beta-D-ribofuranosyl 5'-monophosphate synthetase
MQSEIFASFIVQRISIVAVLAHERALNIATGAKSEVFDGYAANPTHCRVWQDAT